MTASSTVGGVNESKLSESTAPGLLKIGSTIAAIGVFLQMGMGVFVLMQGEGMLQTIHGYVGYATLLAAIVAAVGAVMWKRTGGSTGTMAHAISMPVLMIVQVGLAEMNVPIIHAVFGVLIGIGVVALALMVNGAKLAEEDDD